MIIQTHDGKQFEIPQDKVESFLKDYNNATGFDPRKLSPDPEVNPERGANWAGVARSAAQGLPVIGSYADEAEASVRSLVGDKSYDEYLKNARESYEGAKENIPEWAYPAEIGTGILGEAGLAALTGGASLHPAVQGAMGTIYGYGMGEGDALNRTATAGVMGTASAFLPVAGKYGVKYGVKKPLEYFGKKIANKEMPALTKALIKPNSAEKTVVSTDLSKVTSAIIDNINKADVLPEEKPVIQTIVDALSNNSQKNAHLLFKDANKAVMNAYEKGGLSPDSFINLKGAISNSPKTIDGNDAFTINHLRTLVNKGESIAEKTAVADDLLKNTTKVKSLYNTVNKDIDEMLALSWEDQLKDTFIDLQSKYADKFSQDVIQRLYNKVLSATANSAEQVIKDSSNDLITRNLTKEIKNIVASESGLSKEFAQGLEDRIISEVLSRRTAASLAGKSLRASSEGLIGSVALDATMGVIADAVLPGAGAGIAGALIRNVLPGNSSLSIIKGALKDKAVDSVIAKNVARDNTVATIVSANEKGLLNRYGENEIKDAMKIGTKAAASRETAGQKIVNALKPYKAVGEGIKEASKKPTKQLVKEALQVTPKTAIPVGIRETTRELYNNGVIPFAAKPKREEPLKQYIVKPKEVTPTVQQPVEIPKATMNPNNLSHNTIVLPGSEGDTSSSMEKFIRMIQALYPQYYQKVA